MEKAQKTKFETTKWSSMFDVFPSVRMRDFFLCFWYKYTIFLSCNEDLTHEYSQTYNLSYLSLKLSKIILKEFFYKKVFDPLTLSHS